MKKNFLIISSLLLVTLACNATLPQIAPTSAPTLELSTGQGNSSLTEANVPRVSLEDAKAALESGEGIIVDVRSSESYAESHIAGAISIPLGEFESNIANVPLDKNQWIITYCS